MTTSSSLLLLSKGLLAGQGLRAVDLSLKEPELVLLSPLSLGGERHSEKQRKGERDTQRHRD